MWTREMLAVRNVLGTRLTVVAVAEFLTAVKRTDHKIHINTSCLWIAEHLLTAIPFGTIRPIIPLVPYGNRYRIGERYFPIPHNSHQNDGPILNPGTEKKRETFESAVTSFFVLSLEIHCDVNVLQMLLLIWLQIWLSALYVA